MSGEDLTQVCPLHPSMVVRDARGDAVICPRCAGQARAWRTQRADLAEKFMVALLRAGAGKNGIKTTASIAVACADALITELAKPKEPAP